MRQTRNLRRTRTDRSDLKTVGRGLAAALLTLALLMPAVATPASAAAPNGSWSPAVPVQADPAAFNQLAHVAAAANGDAVAVWLQSDASGAFIWGAAFSPASGWGAPVRIQTRTAGGADGVDAAINADGTAVAAWTAFGGGHYNVWAARYVPGLGWGSDVLLENSDYEACSYPSVGVDGGGNSLVVWCQDAVSPYSEFASRFDVTAGWGAPVAIESYDAISEHPQVAVDPTGAAIAVWGQSDGANWAIAANRYVPGVGWGSAAYIASNITATAQLPSVAVDAAGNAVAVWQYNDFAESGVFANRYVVGSGWAGVVGMEDSTVVSLSDARVAVSPSGNATVVWMRTDATTSVLWARSFSPPAGWGVRGPIESTGSPFLPSLALDGQGNAMVAFTLLGSVVNSVMAVRQEAGGKWLPASRIAGPSNGSSSNAVVSASGPSGFVFAWIEDDWGGNFGVWSRWFEPADRAPPALTLTSPADGAKSATPQVRIAGTTEPGARVSVDGYAAAVATDGSFSIVVPLGAGATTITVTATDAAGNVATASRGVTFDDPIPGLEAALAAAEANASGAQAGLASAQEQLAQALSDAAAARASANATAAQLAATQASLSTTQGQLAATQTTLNATRASATGGAVPAGDSTALFVSLAAVAVAGAAVALSMRGRGGGGSGGSGGGGGGGGGTSDGRIAIKPDEDLLRMTPGVSGAPTPAPSYQVEK